MNRFKPYRPEPKTLVRCQHYSPDFGHVVARVFRYYEYKGREWAEVGWTGMAWDVPSDALRPIYQPGIGAVVAMVAAARMAEGFWGRDGTAEKLATHWSPLNVSTWGEAAACGVDDAWAPTSESIHEVTCPDCLKMYRRVYGEEKAPTNA
jgi:hypothetical protein